MHMDKTGILWPCIGCTRPSSMSHCMYCKMSNHYGDPEFMWKIDPKHDPKIPLQYVTAYKDCNYLDLKTTAPQLISMVTKSCGAFNSILSQNTEKKVQQIKLIESLPQMSCHKLILAKISCHRCILIKTRTTMISYKMNLLLMLCSSSNPLSLFPRD